MNINVTPSELKEANRVARETISRAENDAHRAAEDKARNHRLDKDRVIAAALDALKHKAYFGAGTAVSAAEANTFLRGYVFGAGSDVADVLSLIDEIRADLPPQLR